MPYLSLGPVSEALVTRLNVPALLLRAPGGATDDPVQGIDFPFVWFEVFETRNYGGLGTAPGRGARREIEVRLHAFTRSDETVTWARNHEVMQIVLELLMAAPLLVTDYLCGDWHPDVRTTPLAEVELQGVKVKELVTTVLFWVTEAPAVALQRAAAVEAFLRKWRP
jgi:hypothetical protein